MSHTTTIKTIAIKDTAAMQAAVAELVRKGVNCKLSQDKQPRMYYANQHGKCPYVLELPGCPYDVGFEKQADGSYAPVFDEWAGHISGQLGAGKSCPLPNTPEGRAQHQIGQFYQFYGKHAAINAATAQGYMVESADFDKAGNVQLVLTGM